jgi:hypothetical protein
VANQVQIQRLTTEDFAGQKWAEKLVIPLNTFMESVQSALTNGLTITDNMSGAIKTFEVDGTWPVRLAWQLGRPATVIVGNVVRSDGVAFTLAGAVQVQWQYNQNGQLQIDGITGVTPSTSNKYKITIQAITG